MQNVEPLYKTAFNEGIDLYESRKFKQALEKFNDAEKNCDLLSQKKLLSQTNTNEILSQIYSAKGIIYYEIGEYNESEYFFKGALEYKKDSLFIRICLAELYLSINNPNLAYDQIKEFVENESKNENKTNNKNYAHAKEIEGRIKIENKKYDRASKCFINAMTYDLDRCNLLLWDVYSRYLSAIFNEPQDQISKENLFFIIEKLETICDYCERKKDKETKMIALYYLGYFYARSNDFISAIDRYMQCLHLTCIDRCCSQENHSFFKSIFSRIKGFFSGQSRMAVGNNRQTRKIIQNQAHEHLKNIYQRAYYPGLFDWWWNSPINPYLKKIGFCGITGTFFLTVTILAIYPFFLTNDINTLMAEIEPLQNKNLSLEEKKLALEERNYQIEQIWIPYNAFKSFSPFLIGFLLFIFFFPKIESFKAGGIELGLVKSPVPPEIFISPSAMREFCRLE